MPSACGRSCGCVEGEKVYETYDGKVDLALVRDVHWGGGRFPGPTTTFSVHVATDPAFDEPTECDHVDFAENDEGTLAAFRCKKATPTETTQWTILRLRGGDRRLRECDAPVGDGRKPAFERLPSVRASAYRILGCATNRSRSQTVKEIWPALVRAIREDESPGAAAAFVAESASQLFDAESSWDAAFHALDTTERTEALSILCKVLERADAPAPAYERAARRCTLDTRGAIDGALARLRAGLVPASDPPRVVGQNPMEWNHEDRALVWAGAIAGAYAPREAGEIACSATSKPFSFQEPDTRRQIVMTTVLARTKTRCPGLAEALVKAKPCGAELDCDGGLCSTADFEATTRSWTLGDHRDDEGVRRDPSPPLHGPSLLAAGALLGPLPDVIRIPNARRRYGRDEDAGSPSCRDGLLEAGAPCRCEEELAHTLCEAPIDAGRGRIEGCSFRIDDRRHTIEDMRRICDPEGAECGGYRLCCLGTRCVNGRCAQERTEGGSP